MKSKKLSIQINRPVAEVFEFVTDPANTPKWIDFITQERTNEWPPKLGTVYQNQDTSGQWRELVMTKFEQGKMFVMSSKESGYHVKYTLNPIDDNSTEMIYEEYVEQGELEDPFTIEILQKLKAVIEAE
ncbi:MAG TPA: SRPBCC family protein [Candidatus Saccharimonadales bacterium]|nr:SRPBCC family protein [Candidatus Saccharimonadales bacterium]